VDVARRERVLDQVLSGSSDANISFSDLCRLLRQLGFDQRIRGDHHIFTKTGVEEILNLQPKRAKAKPYQVKQVRGVLLKYKLETDIA
jgi:predicted RNA binding protein YcfA (HicA-like mRNA interferase family)